MTARAFLRLSDELKSAFSEGQDDEMLRYLKVEVVDADTLTNTASRQKGPSFQADFDSLSQASKKAQVAVVEVLVDAGNRGTS